MLIFIHPEQVTQFIKIQSNSYLIICLKIYPNQEKPFFEPSPKVSTLMPLSIKVYIFHSVTLITTSYKTDINIFSCFQLGSKYIAGASSRRKWTVYLTFDKHKYLKIRSNNGVSDLAIVFTVGIQNIASSSHIKKKLFSCYLLKKHKIQTDKLIIGCKRRRKNNI